MLVYIKKKNVTPQKTLQILYAVAIISWRTGYYVICMFRDWLNLMQTKQENKEHSGAGKQTDITGNISLIM